MYEDYTIRQFENAQFKNDRSVMNDEQLSIVYNEYIDTAKLFETEEFTKVGYIEFLNGRINTVKLFLQLQRSFIINFEIPYIPGFNTVINIGYSVTWKNDKELFLKQLEKIEKSERTYMGELENCMKDLHDFRAAKNSGEQPVKLRRESFLKTIISLRKNGHQIDKDRESVEDLALIILQETEKI